MTNEFRKVQAALVRRGHNTDWLAAQVRERTGRYADRHYIGRVLNGKISSPNMVSAIEEVLGIKVSTGNKKMIKEDKK